MAVYTSMVEYSAKIAQFVTESEKQQRLQIARAEDRLVVGLIRASTRAAGSDRRLSRVGGPAGFEQRGGAFLGFLHRPLAQGLGVEFKKTGPWQFRDSTVNAGPTQPHLIGPRPDRNKRPLTPATHNRPSMREVGGGWLGQGYVLHGGSQRERFWGGAIQRVMPVIQREFKKMWFDTPKRVFK